MNLPREAALRLNVSISMLRKLTLAGEIGHVRLGTGAHRQRIGYTDVQIEQFISSRTVPPSPAHTEPVVPPRRLARRRVRTPAPEPQAAASSLVKAALARGTVKEWSASS